ncbi:hypothetical protein [Williamsia herbipolensis]|uniref:hypothetical protein n=1 Tax=Williamsia herbipolensis TaxID=1603258 RepID=UPI001364D6E5|nr:hypothetical protein [Williamsia herbipolensis]
MSDHETDTGPTTPYAELHRVMRGPGPLGYAFTIAPPVSGVPKGAPIDSHTDPAVLMARAEAVGGGHAAAAVCGAVRAELLIVDIDSCAELAKTQVIDAATDAGAVWGYEAASGSPDSCHLGFAVTPAVRVAAAAAIAAVRALHGLSKTDVDVRSKDHHLRYPGSASLKGTGRCVPVTAEGAPMTAIAAAKRLKAALAAVDDGALDLEVTPSSAAGPRRPTAPPPSATAPPVPVVDDEELEISRWDLEPERAWRAPTPIAAEGYQILDRSVDPKLRERIMRDRTSASYTASPADKARWKRENGSQLATDGAWVVYRSGIKSWKLARPYYRRYRCFAKFAALDAAARAAGTPAVHSFKHWQSVKERAESWRPAMPAPDAAFIAQVLDEIARWDDPDAVAAAAQIVHQRFADGHGADIPRPLAERTVAIWLSVSPSTARKRLTTLVDRGLLSLEIPHDRHSNRHEAHCYRLRLPSPKYRTECVHDVTRGGTYTHPLWGDLGQSARYVYDCLTSEPSSTSRLAALTHQQVGTSTYGVLRVLRALQAAGLADRHGSGNATTWCRGPASLDDAALQVGTIDRHTALVATINTERKAWHATTPRTSYAARSRLSYLRKRQHHNYRTTAPANDQLRLYLAPTVDDAVSTPRYTLVTSSPGAAYQSRSATEEDVSHVPGPDRLERRSGSPTDSREQSRRVSLASNRTTPPVE